jgi:hypothetical protein
VSSTTEFTITLFGLAFVALAWAAIGLWRDRRKQDQRELDALNDEYKRICLREWKASD